MRKNSLFTNGIRKTRYPKAKERNWILISYHIQNSTQNRLKTEIYKTPGRKYR